MKDSEKKMEELIMARYKVTAEQKRWIRHVLVRGFHEFRFLKGEDGGWECEINVSETTFDKIRDRAKCEQYAHENGIKDLVVTAREAWDHSFITYTLAFFHQTSCTIIDPDNYMKYYDALYAETDVKDEEENE